MGRLWDVLGWPWLFVREVDDLEKNAGRRGEVIGWMSGGCCLRVRRGGGLH